MVEPGGPALLNRRVDLILPTATSAVRDAAYGPAFVDYVLDKLGLQLRVLDGEREAYYGVIGALNEVGLRTVTSSTSAAAVPKCRKCATGATHAVNQEP